MLIWGSRAAAKSRPGNGCTKPSAPLKVLTFATHYWAPHCHTPVLWVFVRTFQYCLPQFYLSFQAYRPSTKLCSFHLIYRFYYFFFISSIFFYCLFPSRALRFLSPCCVSLPCCCFVSFLVMSLTICLNGFFSLFCAAALPIWSNKWRTKTTVFKYLYTSLSFLRI